VGHEFIPDDHVPYLPDLVTLRSSAGKRLKVEDFDDTFPREDVMAAPNAFAKTEREQKVSQRCESNVVVGVTSKDLIEKLVVPGHSPATI
jgi:hypothetical protein